MGQSYWYAKKQEYSNIPQGEKWDAEQNDTRHVATSRGRRKDAESGRKEDRERERDRQREGA